MLRTLYSKRPNRFGPPGTSVLLVPVFLVLAALGLAAPSTDSLIVREPPDTTELGASVIPPPPGQHDVLPAVAQPFRRGESLRFSVQWGPIKAGSAYLEVSGVQDWNGHEVYNLVARAESNSFFNHVYKVRNRIESFWDKGGLFSRRYTENRREGGYREKSEITFDHERHEALYADGRSFPVPPQVQDALSSFYYTRFQALPVGGSIVFDYHASGKSQPMEVRILGREKVETPAGTFDCVVIEPILRAAGIFTNQGRLVIWLTDDDRRIPVLMKSKVTIGSISVVLIEARRG